MEHPAEALAADLGLATFRQRAPWWGADLQTLRNTLRRQPLPPDKGQRLEIPIGSGDRLLMVLDRPLPPRESSPLGLVLLAHGLGGSSEGEGVRRLAISLQNAGLAVLRLNLRGAGPGRPLARGTYAASCNSDLVHVLARARQLGAELAPGRPLLGAGISMGGTLLLNAVLDPALATGPQPVLDGLVCISSPLDLVGCARQFELPRNRLYAKWLVRGLRSQTLADPFGVGAAERAALEGVTSIRGFDTAITAPRWGFDSVEHYYAVASPLQKLLAGAAGLPPTLVIHAMDDPWVPAADAIKLAQVQAERPGGPLKTLLTPTGGHNGFHGPGGCWSDQLTTRWLGQLALGNP